MEDGRFMTQITWTILHTYPNEHVDARWREFLTEADFAAHYVSPEYFREPFLRDKRPFVILVWQDQRVVAALSGIHEGQQVLCGLRSRPQICFDKNVDLEGAADALVQGLSSEAGSQKLITFYSWVPLNNIARRGYQCQQEEGVVMLDLTRGADELFKEFAQTRRTDIRNTIKRGLEVVIASTSEEFRTYYDMYADWCRRKRITPHPFKVVEEALNLQNRRLFLARYEGNAIAATIVRCYPQTMIEYAANSSYSDFLKFRPNDLLQWRIVEWACAQDYKRYSLGGAHLFVRRMGGSIAPIYRYRLDRTWLHRHELKEALRKSGRNIFNALPGGLKRQVRRAIKGHE
jgi:hypothetical protein